MSKRLPPQRSSSAVRTVNAGLNSPLAVVLDTDAGRVFVKGLRVDHPGVVRQGREAMINPYVHAVAQRLRWHQQAAGWDLLALEYIDGARYAITVPGLLICRVSFRPCRI